MHWIKIIGDDPLADRLRRLLPSDCPTETSKPRQVLADKPLSAAIVTDASTLSLTDLSALLQPAKPVLCHVPSILPLDRLRQWRKIILGSSCALYFAWPLRFAPAVCRLKDLLRDQTVLAVSSLAAGPGEIVDQPTFFDGPPAVGGHRNSEFRIQNSELSNPQPPSLDPQPPSPTLLQALDLLRYIVGDFTHVTALGTALTQPDLLAASPSALVTSLHAADRTLAQHVQVQSAQLSVSLDVLTATARYQLDCLRSTLTIQDAAGETAETFPDDAWPALLRIFLDSFTLEPDGVFEPHPALEPDAMRPATRLAQPPPAANPVCPGRQARHPGELSNFDDSFPTFTAAWAVASALTNGQLTAVPLR